MEYNILKWLFLSIIFSLNHESFGRQSVDPPGGSTKTISYDLSTDRPYISRSNMRYKKRGYDNQSLDRHEYKSYRNVRSSKYQVISVYQPELLKDRVYHINNTGDINHSYLSMTHYKNLFSNSEWRDSFNPHGSQNIYEGLGHGLGYSIFGEDYFKMRSAFDY